MSSLAINNGSRNIDAYNQVPTQQSQQGVKKTPRKKNPAPRSRRPRSDLPLVAQYGLASVGISSFKMLFTNKITDYVTETLGFCFGNFVSEENLELLRHIQNISHDVNHMGIPLLGKNWFSEVVLPALGEEVQFRWFIQDVLFTKLPKKIIEQISPQMTSIIDSLPARISRVAATAILFAFIHTHALPCSEGGAIPQFIGGLTLGAMYEVSNGSLLYCTNFHFIYNTMAQLGRYMPKGRSI